MLAEALGRASSQEGLEAVRVQFLGRKGRLAELMSGLTSLSPEDRPAVGKTANRVKTEMTALWEAREQELKSRDQACRQNLFDASVPSWSPDLGSLHPITRVTREICTIFSNLGFEVVSGPEVENDFNNFEALNFPPEHPARDMQDTLYISDAILLRTHTSPLQVRTMLARKPPLGIIAPGKVYRRDSGSDPYAHVSPDRRTFGGYGSPWEICEHADRLCADPFGSGTKVRFRPSFPVHRTQCGSGHELRHMRR